MKKLLTPTLIFLSTLALTYLGAVSLIKPQNVGIALPQAVAIFETSLQTGITSTATSMTLTANSIRGGGSLSGFNCFTVDEGSSNAEVICGTVSGTAVSSMTRGISYEDGETEVAGNKYSHRRGSSVKITDFPIIQRLKAQNNGDSTFVNQLTYESYLTPVDDEDIISKKYADDLAIAGSPDASLTVKGLVEMSSQTGMASTSIAGSGDTTAWLGLSASYSTSTPSGDSYSALHLPVSENDGKLSQLWLDLTEAFTWTGNHIFNGTVDIAGLFTTTATSTMATTTIAELTATNITVTGTKTGLASITDITTFTADGTWTKPTGAIMVCVQAWGGGGGGGSAVPTDTDNSGAGGGGGGAYKEWCFDASDLGATETVDVGAGGAANTAGSNTSFDLVIAYGGGAGVQTGKSENGGGGGGGGSTAVGSNGTADGTTGVGGAGGGLVGSAAAVANGAFGGAGGGDGGVSTAEVGGASLYGGAGGGGGIEGSTTQKGANGGGSVYAGAGGGGGTGYNQSGSGQKSVGGTSVFAGNGGAGGSTDTGGTAGTAPAGGGGGGGGDTAGTYTGGAGADGQVIVTTYF